MTSRSFGNRGFGLALIAFSTLAAIVFISPVFADEAGDVPEEQAEELLGIGGPLQIVAISDGDQTLEIPYATTEDGLAILEGDIILGTAAELFALRQSEQTLQSVSGFELFGLFTVNRRPWPRGIVKYRIANSVRDKERVTQAIAMWENATDIRFEVAPTGESRYVEFTRGASPKACASSVGFQGRKQYLHVGDRCSVGNIAHEIGHTLGIGHEHMRADQDEFITLNRANIRSGYLGNFTPKPWAYEDVGDYCYGSIMHYDEDAFSKNGKPTIVPKRAASIGQRTRIAECDRAVIRSRYGDEFAAR